MRYPILSGAALVLALWLVAGVSPAAAGHTDWLFGGGFRIGDVDFRVGFAGGGPYGPSYYFEAARPFAYRGVACSGYCYRRSSRHYHHPDCPLVRRHFSRYGYAPQGVIQYYGPPVAYRPPRYYGPPVYYGRPPAARYYDRHYDRYWDRRYDKHYWKKHRKRGHHRHHGGHSCDGHH